MRCHRSRDFWTRSLTQLFLEKYAPAILSGVGVTVWLSILIIIAGMAFGTLLACLRAYRFKPLSFFIVIYADIFRALPPLVMILLIFFGLPSVGITLSSFMVLFVVLALILSAFAEEILWAGITSIEKGQWEAARSTGLGLTQTLIFVVLPQAMRLAIPPLTNRAIAITKMTALGTVIGVPDILNQASTAQSFSGNASPLMLAAVAYVVLFLPFVILSRWLENRYFWRKA